MLAVAILWFLVGVIAGAYAFYRAMAHALIHFPRSRRRVLDYLIEHHFDEAVDAFEERLQEEERRVG